MRQIPEQHCPTCRTVVNAFTSRTASQGPKEGSFGICVYCGEYLRFGKDLAIERLPDEVFKALPPKHRAILEANRAAYLNEKLGQPKRFQ
jgi:hypothetical protein